MILNIVNLLKDIIYKSGTIETTSEKRRHPDENKVYEMYYDYHERVNRTLVSHRILAINRAENEKVITVNIEGDKELLITIHYIEE